MEFSYRVFKSGGDTLLAISDLSILGKTLRESEIEIKVNGFYRDKNCDKAEALTLIKDATIVNAVGRDVVSLMKKENIIDDAMVLVVDGVPHAQVIKI